MTAAVADVKSALTDGLTELHLPTMRRSYEDAARLAERETLSYERYLLDLVTPECEDRQRTRIERLLRQSKIPLEKSLANFNLKRLPPKVALVTKTLLEGEFLNRRENVLAFGNPDPETLCFTSCNSAKEILLFVRFPAMAAQPILHCRYGIPHHRPADGVNDAIRKRAVRSMSCRCLCAGPFYS
jgi:hypothetical protein